MWTVRILDIIDGVVDIFKVEGFENKSFAERFFKDEVKGYKEFQAENTDYVISTDTGTEFEMYADGEAATNRTIVMLEDIKPVKLNVAGNIIR